MTSLGSELSTADPFFRILCVEDDSTLQQLLKIGLGTYGFDVITASHGIDALMQYKAHGGQFGAIISNHDMPRLNGLRFVRAIREAGYKGRIVVMSGHLTVEEFREYWPCAISGFFSKPFEVSMLATTLLQAD